MKKIVIWGIGLICKEFTKCLTDGEIIAYIDNFAKEKSFAGKDVYTWNEFKDAHVLYDYIVVASVYVNDIFAQCCQDVDLAKVIFLRPFEQTEELESVQRNIRYLQEIAPGYEKTALEDCGKRMLIDDGEEIVSDCYPVYHYDYFRYRTFELVADQIQNLPGDIAEVGVFQGYFARIINQKFPCDTFYLFDTFEGFDDEEAKRELMAGHCDQSFIDLFKETSVGQVMDKLKYKENCVIKKGFFPETAQDLDSNFKFVSIDVDFEDSIYASLAYFYPRLVKGGFLFIHDYTSGLKGVRYAVERYEKANGTMIKIPLADKGGTLLVTK